MRRKKRLANGTMKCDSPAVDRLGGLPDDVLGHILGFLPTPLAVRATQLSRRWRRLWPAHLLALNLSVYNCNCKNRGVGVRFPDLCTRALARFPTLSIPSISLEFCTRDQIGLVKPSAWYAEAMERAVGSVSVTVPRGAFTLSLPRFTRAQALSLTLTHRIDLKLPDPAAGEDPVHFGRLTELALATVWLPAGTPPLHGFLSSSCPRLRRLRLCCVRGGEAVRALLLRSDALEALDLNNVEGMARLDVAAPNLRSLSVRSCFRFPRSADEDTEAVVSAPRMESICWYRSYPKRLSIADGSLARVRRLSGLKLATLGRSDRFDFPYTMQLLQACSLTTQHLELDLVMPDEMALHNWLGPEERGSCEDLMRYVPPLPRVTVLSLTVRWGIGGDVGVGPCLASLLSRVPSVATIYVHPAPYSLTVLGGAVVPQGQYQRDRCANERSSASQLDSLREMVVRGLRGTEGEECSLVEVLLGTVPPSIEKISLGFHEATAVSVVDEIAAELQAHFPMATAGCWTRTACSTTLEWDKDSKKAPCSNKRSKMSYSLRS